MSSGARTVVLYTRPACGLCDEAARELARLAPLLALRIERKDVTSDASLFERYGMAIPVVELDGREVARAPLRPGVLEAKLRDAIRDTSPAPR
ncbi:MAG: glutaredoxin family protein [Dehalococcoidia bacterium]